MSLPVASGGPAERPNAAHVGGAIWWHSRTRYLWARQLAAGLRVLDIACGNGFGTAVLAEAAREVVGADVSAEAVVAARAQNPRPNVSYVALGGPRLPFADGEFDLVVCLETIEHLPRAAQGEFAGELVRTLAPEGILVLSTPDRDTERAHELATGEANPWHRHTPTRAELEGHLAALPHAVDLVQLDLVATAVLPADESARRAKLEAPELFWGARERPAPISILRAASRAPRAIERVRACRAPIALREDFQRLAFIASVVASLEPTDLSALGMDERLGLLVHRLSRLQGRVEELHDKLSLGGIARRAGRALRRIFG